MTILHYPTLFIAGLGNAPFPATRHSIGQLVVHAIAQRYGMQMQTVKNGWMARSTVYLPAENTPVDLILFKSKAFMNISGPSIATAYRQFVSTPDSMIVLADSLSHIPQKLSVKFGGSAEGHNGVKSIIAALGGEQGFYRFRLGIGRKGDNAADYVMGNLSTRERQFWEEEGLDMVMAEIEKVARKKAG